MNKNISSFFVIVFLLFLLLNKFHSLYAGTKYFGQNYGTAFDVADTNTLVIGDFDKAATTDTAHDQKHWITRYGTLLDATGYQVTTITADASPRAIELDNNDSICYVFGGIDPSSLSQASATQKADYYGIWGEGDNIMTNYTHLGFYAYNETPSSDAGNKMNVTISEIDLVDTYNDKTSQYYWLDTDRTDSFPVGFYTDQGLSALRDGDADDSADVEHEFWWAEIPKTWKGWKFFLLRLGNVSGSGSGGVPTATHTSDNPEGDFTALVTRDGLFNIREVYNRDGNEEAVDASDSYLIDGSAYGNELSAHYGSTFPVSNHWMKGDVEGIKWLEFHNQGTGKIYIDNVMFTRPLKSGAAAATGTARVDYAWISDSIQTTLYDTADTPLSKYWHDSANSLADDVNMATHYGSLWYDITGFIPPTFSALLDGTDVSETMSRISIVSQAAYTTLLNTSNQPYFYENSTAGTTSPNNGADGVFQSPNVNTPPLSYATWYTMFVTPRIADGDDTTAGVGYPQVVNFRFTKPTAKMKVLQSEELSN